VSIAAQSPKGVLLGFDYGTVRVGLAVSDPDRIIASPLETYTRQSESADAAHFLKAAKECRAVALVVGLPLHADGRESAKSLEARAFGAWLGNVTGLPVVFWDERFTTALADDALFAAKMTNKKRRDRRDRVAAQMILQAYIDAGSPEVGTEAQPAIDRVEPDN
jgi:putative Holliday junction resolvase